MKQGDLFGVPPVAPSRAERSPPEQRAPVVPTAASLPLKAEVPKPTSDARPLSPQASPLKRIFSVSELTFQIKENLESKFDRVIVRGEVTGFRGANARGHLYFAIKDARAQLDVIVWQTKSRDLKFQIRDGLSLIIEGPLNVYEVQGRYSLIAERIEPEGVGARALAFEQLKAKLMKEGLLGEGRKQPKRQLPTLPRRIGVVTSSSGAAWRDFLKVLHRRHPRASVLFCNARVQGEDAPIEIARGIRWLSKTDVDVVVVTRGGGSAEDLWAFNDERVVRAIFACPVPVVSAVGHEIDVTLSDLVADVRAPTPSAAAEAVVPVLAELELRLKTSRRRLVQAVERRTLEARHRLQASRGKLTDPRRQLSSRRLVLAELAEQLRRWCERSIRLKRAQLKSTESRLAKLQPQARLAERRAALATIEARLRESTLKRVRTERMQLQRTRLTLERNSPVPRLGQLRQRLATVSLRLRQSVQRQLGARRQRLDVARGQLDALSPLKVLGRGYALVSKGDRIVRRASDVVPDEALTVRLDQGDSLMVTVVEAKPGPSGE